jgi:hypothetical protein
MPIKNYWGIETIEGKFEPRDPKVMDAVGDYLNTLFTNLGMTTAQKTRYIPRIIYNFSLGKQAFLSSEHREEILGIVGQRLKPGLEERSERVVDYIFPYLEGCQRVYDNGTGDKGNAVKLLKRFRGLGKNLEIVTSDVVKIPGVEKIAPNIPWIYRPAGTRHPFPNGYFDACLNIVNLHHAEDPLYELAESARITDGKMVIVENPVLVPRKRFPKWFLAEERYPKLNAKQQALLTGYVDIFMNGLFLGPEVPVPCNMTTEKTLAEACEDFDLKVLDSEFVGYDHPIVREPHKVTVVRSHGKEISRARLRKIKEKFCCPNTEYSAAA